MKTLHKGKPKPSHEISTVEYIACNAPADTDKLLRENGKPGAKTRAERVIQLGELCSEKGDEIKQQLRDIHPDKILFEEEEVVMPVGEPGKFASACGCSIGFDGFVNCEGKKDDCCHKGQAKPQFNNAAGDAKPEVKTETKPETKLPEKQPFFNTTNIAIIGVIAIAVAVVAFSKK